MTNGQTNEQGVINLNDKVYLLVPTGDDVTAAGNLVNEILEITELFIEELKGCADRQVAKAPTSSQYVSELTKLVAGGTLQWLNEWPQ